MILDILYWIVIWILVPLALLCVLIFSGIIAFSPDNTQNKISGGAGFFAGLILCVAYIVGFASKVNQYITGIDNSLAFNWQAALAGFILGFLSLWVVRLIPDRLIGLVSLLLCASSTCALYSYFFSSSIRGIVLYLAIAAIFGVLLHLVFFPRSAG